MQNVGGRVYCGVFGYTQAPEVGECVEAEDGRGAVGEVFERGYGEEVDGAASATRPSWVVDSHLNASSDHKGAETAILRGP